MTESSPASNPVDSDGVIEAARSVRPFLQGLLGPAAQAVDAGISELLNDEHRPPGQVAADLDRLLRSRSTTADFLVEVLIDSPRYRPPHSQVDEGPRRGIEPLPGNVGVVPASRFACPRADYVWYRSGVGVRVPSCPTHRLPLVRG